MQCSIWCQWSFMQLINQVDLITMVKFSSWSMSWMLPDLSWPQDLWSLWPDHTLAAHPPDDPEPTQGDWSQNDWSYHGSVSIAQPFPDTDCLIGMMGWASESVAELIHPWSSSSCWTQACSCWSKLAYWPSHPILICSEPQGMKCWRPDKNPNANPHKDLNLNPNANPHATLIKTLKLILVIIAK